MQGTETKPEWAKALAKVTSGLYILTMDTVEGKSGMLLSWVMQAGFEPPMITLAVQRDREIMPMLENHPTFVLNILGESNTTLMSKFAKYSPEQFEGIPQRVVAGGVVLEEALAYLTCTFKAVQAAADHQVLLAQVTGGELLAPEDRPWAHVRKNGLVY